MNMEQWITLSLERDEHLINAEMANCAAEYPPNGKGIVKRHLQRIAQREVGLAWLAMVILDHMNSPSKWSG